MRHLEANLRTVVLDSTVDLLLSHAVIGSFFLRQNDRTALSSFTTSRKCIVE